MLMNASGAAIVHNLFGGRIDVVNYDSRLTPFMKPHSTYVAALHDNPGGDVQFINNLFVNGADVSQYSKALLPVIFEGNVYTKGSIRATGNEGQKKFGEMDRNAKEKMGKYQEHDAIELNALVKDDYDALPILLVRDNQVYLEIALDKNWLIQQRKLVTTLTLGKAIIPGLGFENAGGSFVQIGTDYLGNKRNSANPSPGPFEILSDGKQRIKVW